MTPSSLITWRLARGFTKTEAADALGVSRNAYMGYEAGAHPVPKVVALACAALAFGLPEHP